MRFCQCQNTNCLWHLPWFKNVVCAISKQSDEYSSILSTSKSTSKRQMNIDFEDQKLKNEAFWNPFHV
jgi:hypothetical protein